MVSLKSVCAYVVVVTLIILQIVTCEASPVSSYGGYRTDFSYRQRPSEYSDERSPASVYDLGENRDLNRREGGSLITISYTDRDGQNGNQPMEGIAFQTNQPTRPKMYNRRPSSSGAVTPMLQSSSDLWKSISGFAADGKECDEGGKEQSKPESVEKPETGSSVPNSETQSNDDDDLMNFLNYNKQNPIKQNLPPSKEANRKGNLENEDPATNTNLVIDSNATDDASPVAFQTLANAVNKRRCQGSEIVKDGRCRNKAVIT